MPAIQKGDLVLVSGASGYIATWVMCCVEAGWRLDGQAR